MSTPATVRWTGIGRWTGFALALLMLVLSFPLILTDFGAAAWTLFLGFLLFGGIAANHPNASVAADGLGILFLIRIVLALIALAESEVILVQAALAAASFATAWLLRRGRVEA